MRHNFQCKAFGNGSSANIKLLKTQLYNLAKMERFLLLHHMD